MNLYQKIRHFLYFRKKGLTDYAVFKMPLTDGDKYALILIALMALAGAAWYWADAIDAERIAMQQQSYKHALEAHKMAQKANYFQGVAFKNEQLVVSVMNGSIVENGRVATYCRLNSAGDCE